MRTSTGPKFLHFHAVFGKKIGQTIGWHPPAGVGAPFVKSWIRHRHLFTCLPSVVFCLQHVNLPITGHEVTCEKSFLSMTKIPGVECNYSDHEGVTAWLQVQKTNTGTSFLWGH